MPDTLLPNILDFIAKVDPVDKLPSAMQQAIARAVRITFLGKGDTLPFDLADPERFLYIIRSGTLEQRKQSGVLRARLGPEDLFGFSFLDSTPGNPADCYNVTALDNTLLYQVPHSVLRTLLDASPQYANLFASQVQARLQSALNVVWGDQEKGLFVRQVRDIATGTIASAEASATIREVTRAMLHANRTSTAVITEDGKIVGILTDRDVTLRVVAGGISPERPVSEVMSPAPVTIAPDDLVLRAVALMMEHSVRSLPVVEQGRAIGLLTTSHLVQHHRMQALFHIEKIKYCASVDELAALTVERQAIFEALVEGHVRGDTIGLIMAMIMDAMTRRLIEIAIGCFGPPPCDFVWVAAGSQARNEVHMLSDQDNALLLSPSATHSDIGYFRHLAMYVCNALAACGYPLCSGRFMAASPQWCQPLPVWQEYYRKWIGNPEYNRLLNASVFLELRPLYGNGELCAALQHHLLTLIGDNPAFVRSLTREAVTVTPPLGIFKNLVLEKSGDNSKTLDIKRNALTLIVDLARIYGLSAGADQQGTEARFAQANAQGLLSTESHRNILGAYHFLLQMRQNEQCQALRQGQMPSNRIDPTRFGSFERQHLKDAFRIIAELQEFARLRFTLE